MPPKLSESDTEQRRIAILDAARWCFLNFGFAKTSLDDIAKRANISRTLLYRTFKDKEDIFVAVFAYWLTARHPAAKKATTSAGSKAERLVSVSEVMVVEPWSDMVGAPMAGEFFDVCERIDPEVSAHHRKVATQCVASVLGDKASADVFILALDGLLADTPSVDLLRKRVEILAARFASHRAS